jgi:DNA ligase (NAD+)
LGIRYVGETTAKYLAQHFRTLDAIAVATLEELAEAEEVGSKIAVSIVDYFASEENKRIIERLRKAGVELEVKEKVRASNALDGKSVVVSGKFPGYSRDDMKAMVEQHGGRNLAAVSANVDFIVAGDNMGPAKRQKAEKLGVTILSLEEFLSLISDAPHIVVEAPAEEKRVDAEPIQGTLF